LAVVAERLKKIDEAAKKRAEEESNFIKSTKESLEGKMETFNENRENKLADLKNKLVNHVSQVN